jgi:hypothetical protein
MISDKRVNKAVKSNLVTTTAKKFNLGDTVPLLVYATLSFAFLFFGSWKLGLSDNELKTRILVNLPLVFAVLATWQWIVIAIDFKRFIRHFGFAIIIIYFTIPAKLFIHVSHRHEPMSLNLPSFSPEGQKKFDFLSIYTLPSWILIVGSFAFLGYRILKKLQVSLILPFCIVLNSAVGFFNSGINNAYTWAPSWRNPWTVFTYGDSTSGVVNSDEPVHRALSDLFNSGDVENLMLVRRAFPYFLSSPLTSVVGNFLAFQIFNTLFVIAMLILAKKSLSKLVNNKTHLNLILLTIAIYPQIIFYQYQSSGYAIGIALSSMLLLSTIYLLTQVKTKFGFVGFLIGLFFSSLSYDMILAGIAITFVLLMKGIISKLEALLILLISIFPGYLFEIYVEKVAMVQASNSNSGQILTIFQNISIAFKEFDIYFINSKLLEGVSGFVFTNGLLLGSSVFLVVMIIELSKSKKLDKAHLQLEENLKVAMLVNLVAHIFWNLGSGWQFNIPRLTASFGIYFLISLLVLTSAKSTNIFFIGIWSTIFIVQLIILLPFLFNTYDLTWLSISGGY